ncbi:MAG TPA: 3-oxoacyl-ACP synthase [Clostridiales bacterium]|nr:MAG: 3-oxoacyl-ACP synthase [Clostridiales bacterium GWD2_32_19]HCC07359.1 3-oxoacyl-ACP synthase [Clostridiales bacterium]
MRNIRILGMGSYLPKETVSFDNDIRYRITGDETQLHLAVSAIGEALKNSELDIKDIDCIVSCSAVTIQPIPNMSSLIHEHIAQGLDIPCVDINTTCTSFIAALDIMSYMIDAGRYNKVLIVASDVPSLGLNKNQRESYELFSDAAVAIVVAKDETSKVGVIYGLQKTWSEGAHQTQVAGGGTSLPPCKYSEENKEQYMFDMQGINVAKLAMKKLPQFLEEFYENVNEKVDYIIPHQASKLLDIILKKVGLKKGTYLNIVNDYGNMVSASVPFALKHAIDNNIIKRGDNVLLIGTAAGLHINGLLIKY